MYDFGILIDKPSGLFIYFVELHPRCSDSHEYQYRVERRDVHSMAAVTSTVQHKTGYRLTEYIENRAWFGHCSVIVTGSFVMIFSTLTHFEWSIRRTHFEWSVKRNVDQLQSLARCDRSRHQSSRVDGDLAWGCEKPTSSSKTSRVPRSIGFSSMYSTRSARTSIFVVYVLTAPNLQSSSRR